MLVQPDTRSLPPTGAAYVADEGELAMSSAAAAAAERAENAGFWGLEKTPFIKLVRRRVKRTVARPTHKASQEPTPESRVESIMQSGLHFLCQTCKGVSSLLSHPKFSLYFP